VNHLANDDSKEKNNKEEVKKRLKEIEEKSKKKDKKNKLSVAEQLATRSKLERDYDEDTIYVSFRTSPETKRTVLAKRPNNKEYIEVLKLGIQAARFEKSQDPKVIDELTNVISKFSEIAGKLTIDESLDEEFWSNNISSLALQDFINSLIEKSQEFGGVSESDMKSFR
jgi:preprotein translocase subunit Sss1